MKQLLAVAYIISIFAIVVPAQETTSAAQPILFDRLGGNRGISNIVDDVVDAHMINPAIKERFIHFRDQPERLKLIKQHIIEFFTAGSGGPANYSGKDMVTTHKGMNINSAEFISVVDDIMFVLNKHKIDEESKKDVLTILWSMKGMIISNYE
ncbi:MAG: group 1 truncated hemoglobin [Ignavibacteriaceae bacterium]